MTCISAKCDCLMKMLLEALCVIIAVHLSTVHGPVSASWSCIPLKKSYEPRCREELLEIQVSNLSRKSRVYNDKGSSDRQKGQTIYVIRHHSRSISQFNFHFFGTLPSACCLLYVNDIRNIPAVYLHSSANGDEAGILSAVQSRP